MDKKDSRKRTRELRPFIKWPAIKSSFVRTKKKSLNYQCSLAELAPFQTLVAISASDAVYRFCSFDHNVAVAFMPLYAK